MHQVRAGRVAALVVGTVVVAGTVLATPASAATASDGQRCTIVGTSGADRLVGTSRVDVICGLGGDDTILGGGGADVLDGGPGNDRLLGGAGADLLLGGAGDDTLVGGAGADTLVGGAGRDIASYADHNARVVADLDGRRDDGSVGELDRVDASVESLVGGSGPDLLVGSAAANTLVGGVGNDRLLGGAGTDVLSGGVGDDVLDGGYGDDTLLGGAGSDTLVGGAGRDTASYADHRAAVTADLDGRRDDGSTGERDLVTTTVENLVGGAGSDRLTGSGATNVLRGMGGNDALAGSGGSDVLDGGAGRNVCDADTSDARVVSCISDSTPPTIQSIVVLDPIVDLHTDARSARVRMVACDDLSYVSDAVVAFSPGAPASLPNVLAVVRWVGAVGDCVALEGPLTFPASAPGGSYTVFAAQVSDSALNHVDADIRWGIPVSRPTELSRCLSRRAPTST